MMTFKEYLVESNIMSTDALKSAMSDYDKRRMGKTDGSKPKAKRMDQMDKRRKRKAGNAENEEQTTNNGRGRPKTPAMLKPQSGTGHEDKKRKRGRPKTPAMLKRQAW